MKKSYKIKMLLMLYSVLIYYVEKESLTSLYSYEIGFLVLQLGIIVIELCIDLSRKRLYGYIIALIYLAANYDFFLSNWMTYEMVSNISEIILPVTFLIIIMDLLSLGVFVEEVDNEETI